MMDRMRKWWGRERDARTLERLDARLLDDIGLSRDTMRDRVTGRGKAAGNGRPR